MWYAYPRSVNVMMFWRWQRIGIQVTTSVILLRLKHTYNQRYEKFLMRWGSGLFWMYAIQCLTGITLALNFTPIFDTGTLAILFIWWETSTGSLLIRIHSEMANLLFVVLYLHVFTKLYTSLDNGDVTSQVSWLSGSVILILTYIAGVTGAIMPCSTLSEVTATIVGSALASLVYVKFDFLETIIVPGVALNEEAIFRTFIIHAVAPLLGLVIGLIHMVTLHVHKYTAGGGFERLMLLPRFRATQRWSYGNRYWTRAFGTWTRIFVVVAGVHILHVLFKLVKAAASYGLMNSEYWPITEVIDFVLTIPHWYLRPLMGALVTIPHHYLGFIYIGIFFILIINAPWNYEVSEDSNWENRDDSSTTGTTTTRSDWIHSIIALNFVLSAMFTTAIIPTGKYFIAIGSMDGLVYTYWALLFYLAGAAQSGFFTHRKNWAVLGQ